jgi:hypothetical protein
VLLTWRSSNATPIRTPWSRQGVKRLTTLIEKHSNNHQGIDRARQWINAAERRSSSTPTTPRSRSPIWPPRSPPKSGSCEPCRPSSPNHATERETAYRWVDPAELARSLPGLADIGGPALVAAMGDPARFARGKQFRSFTGLVPKASETGDTDRKGQPMSKAGSSLLRTTLVRAADNARKQDPQLARIYCTCRWSSAARTTSARSASWPPTSPNGSGPS